MELVATVKLKKWKDKMENNISYLKMMEDIILSCVKDVDTSSLSELNSYKNATKTLYVVVTSSLGLCGGYNYNLFKFLNTLLKKDDKVLLIGTKGLTKIDEANNEIEDDWGEEDVSIDLNERGAIYVDNLVQSDDNAYGIQFQFPCKFIVVAGGKVVDTFVVDEEPSEVEGYLYTDIPYDYELEEVEARLEEEDSEWIEDDMMGLINRTEKDEWIHSLEVGDLGDGLYVQDVDSYLYSVVIGGKVVLSFE